MNTARTQAAGRASPGTLPWVAVLGDLGEEPCALLLQALRQEPVRVLALDSARGRPPRPHWVLDGAGALSGGVDVEGECFELAALRGLYLRPAELRAQPGAPSGADDAAAHARRAGVQDWIDLAELTDARVANRLSAMASNASKPLQSKLLADIGLAVPPMLLSNDPEAVRAFEAAHGRLIFKSASGVRSIVQPLDGRHRERLESIRHTPTLFQKRLSGTNVRVHVVGESVFATEIDSDGLDYRYAGREGGHTRLRATRLPLDIEAACRRAARVLALPFAGIDLMLADDGEVYAFEVNPSPGYSYYESATGQPIAAALARWLARGDD